MQGFSHSKNGSKKSMPDSYELTGKIHSNWKSLYIKPIQILQLHLTSSTELNGPRHCSRHQNFRRSSRTLMDLRASRSSHLLAPSRMLVSITASTCALASSSRWFRHLFQAWKAPSLRVCLRNRMATVCSSLAVRYLHLHRLVSALLAEHAYAQLRCPAGGLRGFTSVRVTSSYLRVLTRKAGSLRWEGWVSCDTRGLGGRESLAICLRYPHVAPRGFPLNLSLYLFNSMAATWDATKQLSCKPCLHTLKEHAFACCMPPARLTQTCKS